jgi:hypothetical protein
MKMFYYLSLIIIILCCKSANKKLYEIDPRTFADNKITLSEIADDIQYITLDDSIPFVYFKYVITPDNIYVSAKDIGILRFDRKGILEKRIGRKGRGPGEFINGMSFTVDEGTGNIFVKDIRNRMKIYSKKGTFLRDISLENLGDKDGWEGDIEVYNSLLFVPNCLGTGDSEYSWVILDTLGNLVKKKKNSVPPFKTYFEREAQTFKFEDRICYYNYFDDTIYSISPDLNYRAEYLFARGDHRWSKTGFARTLEEQIPQMFKTFIPGRIFETKHFIVIPYDYLDVSGICFIEKRSKKTFLAYKPDEGSPKYIQFRKNGPHLNNDLDGGLPLKNLRYYSENGEEYITTIINPFDLINYVLGHEFSNSSPKYPDKKKELERLASSLKETDNPVLMMVRLKK